MIPYAEVFIMLKPVLSTSIELMSDNLFSKINPLFLQSGECFHP